MSGLNASEIVAKKLGDVYLATIGTGPPDDEDLTDPAALAVEGWANRGWIAEDGFSAEGFEGTQNPLTLWNRIAPARVVTSVENPEVTVQWAQWNVETLTSYFAGADYDAPSRTLMVPEGGESAPEEMLVVVQDGDMAVGLWFGRVQSRPGGNLEFPTNDAAPIPVTYSILSTGDPTEWLAVIGIDPAADEDSSG